MGALEAGGDRTVGLRETKEGKEWIVRVRDASSSDARLSSEDEGS